MPLKPQGPGDCHQAALEIAVVQGHREKTAKAHGEGIKEGDKQVALKHCSRIRLLVGLKDRHRLGRTHRAQEETAPLKTNQAGA